MTDCTLHAPAPSGFAGVGELRARQPALAAVGLAFLALAAIAAALPLVDARLLGGVSVWAKPAKFFLSSGLFMLTSAWLFGLVRPERRRTTRLTASVRTLIAAACFELGYITFQAAQGEASHFNRSDLLHFALYGMMGVAALAMIATQIPLAIEIARRPAAGLDPAMRFAAVTGVALTVALGTLSGVYMSQRYGAGHDVGAVGGAAPLFGWNRSGGDLRVAHFFGMHGEQILPLVAWATTDLALAPRRRIIAVVGAALVAFTVAVFVQATMGRPFPLG